VGHFLGHSDLVEGCEPYAEIYLFAYDAKLFRHIEQSTVCKIGVKKVIEVEYVKVERNV